jgi:hypothetical protein
LLIRLCADLFFVIGGPEKAGKCQLDIGGPVIPPRFIAPQKIIASRK